MRAGRCGRCAAAEHAAHHRGWIQSIRFASDSDVALRESPYTASLLPTVFEHDRLGRELAYTFGGSGFNPALARLAGEDEQIRQLVMAGCPCYAAAARPTSEPSPLCTIGSPARRKLAAQARKLAETLRV